MTAQNIAIFAGSYDHGSIKLMQLTFVSASDLAKQTARIEMNHDRVEGEPFNGVALMVGGEQFNTATYFQAVESFDFVKRELLELLRREPATDQVQSSLVEATRRLGVISDLHDVFYASSATTLREMERSPEEVSKEIRDIADSIEAPEGQLYTDLQFHLHVLANEIEYLAAKVKR